MKKKLNVDAVLSELRGNSAFFPGYKEKPRGESAPETTPVPLVKPATVARPHPVPPVRVVPPVPPVRDKPTTKRVMKQRHPFDIYRDQYEALQEIALEERRQGGVGSMSAMVREALGRIIAEKRKAQK